MRLRASGGFTLVEILVVLAILGLAIALGAGAVPRRSAGLDLAIETDTLAGALREARARAIAQSRPITFGPLQAGEGWILDGFPHWLPPKLRVALAGPASVVFAPDGSATAARITLVGEGRSTALRIDWLTGEVFGG